MLREVLKYIISYSIRFYLTKPFHTSIVCLVLSYDAMLYLVTRSSQSLWTGPKWLPIFCNTLLRMIYIFQTSNQLNLVLVRTASYVREDLWSILGHVRYTYCYKLHNLIVEGIKLKWRNHDWSDPVHPSIGMHILPTVSHTFLEMVIRRICSTIKSLKLVITSVISLVALMF